MKYLSYEKEDAVGILTFNRPEALNALNSSVLEELSAFLQGKAKEEHLQVLIVTGAGEKAFIAGADIKEMATLSTSEMEDFCRLGQQTTFLLEEAPFLTIAAVNGYALGGGLEIALACDFIYASRNAKLGLPEVTLGIIPGFGGTQRLSRAVGTRLAKEMIATGKYVSAEEVLAMRLVNEICEPGELLRRCKETAHRVAKYSTTAIDQGKKVVNRGYHLDLHEALDIERKGVAVCFDTEERQQAMRAFIEKQKK